MNTEEETLLVAYLLRNRGMTSKTVRLARYFLASLPERRRAVLRALVLEGKSWKTIAESTGVSRSRISQILDGIDGSFSQALLVSCIASPEREDGEATAKLMRILTQVVWPLVASGRPNNLLVHFGRDDAQASIKLGVLREAMREHGFDDSNTEPVAETPPESTGSSSNPLLPG